jgi:hypothetical protein
VIPFATLTYTRDAGTLGPGVNPPIPALSRSFPGFFTPADLEKDDKWVLSH